jgi:transcriptional regulator with XRE-family HTH domain
MQEKVKEIAARIRELRDVSGHSVEHMASSLDINVEEYEKFEAGDIDISASMLFEIARLLGVDMTVLLTGENPRMHIFTITRRGEGSSVDRRKQYGYEALASAFIHRKAEPFVVTVEPCEGEPETNSHPGQEFDYVLEGTLKVNIHNNEIILNAGDSIYFDSGYGHSMKAMHGQPARFLAVIL